MPDSLTDSQTLKDSATQLLIKYKSGALVTQNLFGIDYYEQREYIKITIMMDRESSLLSAQPGY